MKELVAQIFNDVFLGVLSVSRINPQQLED